ncbi:xanthine dehydrogenase small subunit [Zhengella mangrovi]|uniref:Xanthine dehydrogenase small subunit n=1 Tax=Zhengella mangrovi TaxID=1982044 RepID=A0A2G1QLQ5_9HYPH|nr:xanthine dehydrogenase small subunit [Zhengella mangrovi]PHP66404.1 xanthine dehydrogenase small subunit [Zhengella mangrovi]
MSAPAIRKDIRFLLNGDTVTLHDVRPGDMLLDFLRIRRGLTGTKEGCAEGDCGACTVLVGRLGRDGNLAYESVNACIRFLASLDGCHVVTVEHLKGADGGLHPVQQALVDHHGSQCGFCTPGFVMSLYGLWMSRPDADDRVIEKALQGNLCRCTGYESIIRAGRAISDYGLPQDDPLASERETVAHALRSLADGARVEIDSADGRIVIPADVDDLARVLEAEPDATIVSGATDVGLWVTKFMRDVAPVVFIGHIEGLKGVHTHGNLLVMGAGVSYSQAHGVFAEHVPQLAALVDRIGGEQVRNMGTIGGNIANGSPIGDTPPPMIALGATVTLRKRHNRRSLPLEDFFIDYGRQDRAPGEFVESVSVPLPPRDAQFAVYKVSKRRDEDITAVLGAFLLRLDGDGRVQQIHIAFGGMAGVPKRARAVEAVLAGQPWTMATVEAALDSFEIDYQPLTDMRASAAYRMLVAKNLLKRFFLETAQAGGGSKAA